MQKISVSGATSASRFMTGRALKNFIIGDDSTAENRVSTIFSAVKILWLTGGNQLNCFICIPGKACEEGYFQPACAILLR
jgi:hypothetical protein